MATPAASSAAELICVPVDKRSIDSMRFAEADFIAPSAIK
jgi:hypothetical protein